MKTHLVGGIALMSLSLIACSPKAAETVPTPAAPAPAPAAAAPKAGMGMATPAQPAAGAVTGVGVITALNAQAGTLTLKHEAIPAIKWDAMSMAFTADPGLLKDFKVGDAVTFELKSATEPTIVTGIMKK
jgi:Cu/Ag efflux protein CusF